MKKVRTGFFKIDFQGDCKYSRHVDRYDSALQLLSECNTQISRRTIVRFERLVNSFPKNCHEYRLLLDKFLVRRNASGDCARAIKDLRRLLIMLRCYGRKCTGYSTRLAVYIYNFKIEVLKELADCLYYNERDKESLRVYKKILFLAENHSVRVRHINDIRKKVLSLEFMLSPKGCCKAAMYMQKGDFDKALAIVDKAISDFGISHLDHEALIIAAICNANAGNIRKARALIERDYRYSPECLKTCFYWALMNLSCNKSGIPMRIIRKVARCEIQSACAIDGVRQIRIRTSAKLLSTARITGRHLLVDVGTEKPMRIGVIDIMRDCIRFVEVD